jgi:molybdopterin converting factor small subunit
MRIVTEAVSALKEVLGGKVVVVLDDGGTVDDLINKLDEEYGPAYEKRMSEDLRDSIMKRFNFAVNDKVCLPSHDIAHPLKDGDHILFFQSNAGG